MHIVRQGASCLSVVDMIARGVERIRVWDLNVCARAAGTVHFFLNSSSTGRGFPLYTRAIRLAHNREGMVRAAVRTLTLNVYSVPDPDIISFVTSPPAAHYFAEVAHYLAEQVQVRPGPCCVRHERVYESAVMQGPRGI
jgi:hypothetical protein